jgi:PAS domain S-box-containing protein
MEDFWSFLDMRTIFFSMVITNLVCTLVLLLLWRVNAKRLSGISYWVSDFALQTIAVMLVMFRGRIPDILSIEVANLLSMTGIYMGYRGLENYFHLKSKQWPSYAMLLLFALFFTWSTFLKPELALRNLIIGVFGFYFCAICAWLLFFRIRPSQRRTAWLVGLVFILFCLIDFTRIVHYFLAQPQLNNYMTAQGFETFIAMSYSILIIILAFGLALQFNWTLQNDLAIEEEKFSKAFHTSPYAIILTRLSDNHILEINETFHRLTGYEPDDAIGMTTTLLRFWDNPSDRTQVLMELNEGKDVRSREIRFRKKNGEVFTGLYSAQIIQINEEKCLMSSINDISIRKKAEEELRESEAKFKSLFTRMSEGFALHEVIYDAHRKPIDYRILEVNQAFVKMVGITMEEAKGKLSTAAYKLPEAPFLDIYSDVAASGEPQSFRSYFPPFERYYDITVFSPYQGYFATVFSDITEQQQAEDALMNNEIHLRNLNATKDKFFSIIAHDLKSPFNSILGFSKLLGESVRTKDYEHVEQYASIIERSTQRTMDLLMNLLEWSRSQTGKMEYQPEYLELDTIVNEVLDLFEQTALQKNITVQRKLPPFATLYADKILTCTILRNLISNAIKFTHPGGEIQISARQTDGTTEICVSDSGIGIQKEDLKKLFRIEESFSSKGTMNEQGTGLGLLLCKEFVEKQGGSIRVESTVGKGSVFCVKLPSNV